MELARNLSELASGGRGHWLWVLKVFELAAPHIFTARFLSEMEPLVLLAFKLLDKRYQTLIRWTMRSCAYGVVMCNCASFTEYATTRTEGFPAHRGGTSEEGRYLRKDLSCGHFNEQDFVEG